MNAILRVALTCFSIVPLQRWVNGVALLLLGVAATIGLLGRGAGNGVLALTMLGVVLLVMTPAFVGGVALRLVSTRAILHLRPNGRPRILLGATLAITVLAALVALPFLATEWYLAVQGRSPGPRHIPPLDMFMVSWAVLALSWICIFTLSRSALTLGLMGLLPVVVIAMVRVLAPLGPDPKWALLPGVAGWALFAIWYLRTRSVTRPELSMSGDPSVGFNTGQFGRLMLLIGKPPEQFSRAAAMYHYLFGTSYIRFFVLMGGFIGLLFLLMQTFNFRGFPGRPPSVIMLPFLCAFNVSLGFATARRARFLWLRTDLDRAGLFRFAERRGQCAAMTTWMVTVSLIMAPALISQPEQARMLLFMVVQAMMAIAVFYAGMAMTKGWSSFVEVLLSILLVLLMLAQVVAFSPQREIPGETLSVALPVAIVIALSLRMHAARRWRSLDWRVAKLPTASGRT